MAPNPLNLPPTTTAEEVFKTPQQKCEEKGGVWDGKSCTFPQSIEVPIQEAPQGQILTTPEEKAAAHNEIDIINAQDPNAPSAAQAQASNEAQARNAALVGQALSDLTPSELAQARSGVTDAPANLKQALIAGTLGNAGTILGATAGGAGALAATGAGVGLLGGLAAPITSTVGAVGGGIIGGVIGFTGAIYSGVKGNIAAQQKGEIQAAQDYLTQGRTNMQKLALLARQYPELAPQFALDARNQRLQIVRARQQVKAETSGDLNSWLEDGRAELSDFDVFLDAGGTADIMQDRILLAASGGLPAMTDVEFQLALALIE